MDKMLLTIEHNDTLFEPPIVGEVKLELQRTGAPGKLTFTTMCSDDMFFTEGDAVCFYYDNKNIFMGYVFTKKHDKKKRIEVTCYDQLRYLKNKYTYVFEKKTATQIIKALCEDYNLTTGTLSDTNYAIPSVVEENISALDIVLSTLEETLLNSGKLFVLYDDFGKLTLSNAEDMISETLVFDQSAEDFSFTSSIDEETYNSIVLYYKPQSETKSLSASSGAGVARVIQMAQTQIGTKATGYNNVKYNTEYYGHAVNNSAYHWCCVFIWWVFKEVGLSHLFYGGKKTALCATLMSWFKSQGAFYTSNPQPGDIVFFDFNREGVSHHVGIVESVQSNGSIITVEGNTSSMVKRMTRSSAIMGYGRPNYNSVSEESESKLSANVLRWSSYINAASAKYGVSADLIGAVIQAESAGLPNEVSHAGAVGLMQLMPATAKAMGVTNSYDPQQNIDGGTKYLSQMLARYNYNTNKALAAYNAGPGNIGTNGDRWSKYSGYVNMVKKYLPSDYNMLHASTTGTTVNTQASMQVFTASSEEKIKEWGTLRYFEEIKTPSIGATKAKQLLDLYCRKTRELKVNGVFGDHTVRGGTLIPVKLDLGDTNVNNYMVVEKVTHNFKNDHHTMDLTLEGVWKD